ncbi:hypothetical protein SLEP1_g25107 [Rubroshorea leprosula]|uniref:Uncharacterized protein n=1 Tax=Rubroshorea leprosula TaxID=152421 RepID=A0AAV5JP15_9ROSI|nr:hypothetical protein SLEP1_g25107 [Rubroshorea leprosula]
MELNYYFFNFILRWMLRNNSLQFHSYNLNLKSFIFIRIM